MLTWKRLVAAAFVAMIGCAVLSAPSHAAGCGPQNPNCLVPTAPPGTDTNQAASTAFVQQAVSGSGHNPGGINGQIQYNNNGAFGGFTESGDVAVNTSTGVATIQPGVVNSGKIAAGGVANSNLASGAVNTMKGSLNGSSTSDITLIACSAAYQVTKWVSGTGWQCGVNPVLPSRAIAATMNLSAYSVVTTQGYAQPGDGGGATFVNVGTAPFQDSFVTSSTISRAGSGCTNGTDFGSFATGGTGKSLIAVITISSTVLSGINYTYSPGMGYTVGDVLTIGGGGCSVQPQITVSSVSAPLGSFSDSASVHWQIVNEFAVNIKQFGAQPSNTDNFNNIQAAAFFASYVSSPLTQAVGGGRVNVPNGSYTICGSGNSLEIPIGVDFQGASYQAAEIKACSSFNASLNVIELCDPNWHFTCFGAYLDKITITVPGTVASSGFYAVHTNNDQDFGGVYDVYIYGGVRSCLGFDAGYGGASSMWAVRVSCSTDSIYPQIVFGSATSGINLGTTIVHAEGLVLGGSSSGGLYQTGDGIHIYGGFPDISDVHCENMPKCITVDNAAAISNGMASMHNINASSNAPAPACAAVISLTSANTQQNAIISMIPQALSCIDTILNGTSGGTSFTSTVTKPVTCTTTCS